MKNLRDEFLKVRSVVNCVCLWCGWNLNQQAKECGNPECLRMKVVDVLNVPLKALETSKRHTKGYRDTSDEVYKTNPICLDCGHSWPCDVAIVSRTES